PAKARQSDRSGIPAHEKWRIGWPGHRRETRRDREKRTLVAEAGDSGRSWRAICPGGQRGAQRVGSDAIGDDDDYRHFDSDSGSRMSSNERQTRQLYAKREPTRALTEAICWRSPP